MKQHDSTANYLRAMEWLLDDIRRNGLASTPEEAAMRPVPNFATANQGEAP